MNCDTWISCNLTVMYDWWQPEQSMIDGIIHMSNFLPSHLDMVIAWQEKLPVSYKYLVCWLWCMMKNSLCRAFCMSLYAYIKLSPNIPNKYMTEHHYIDSFIMVLKSVSCTLSTRHKKKHNAHRPQLHHRDVLTDEADRCRWKLLWVEIFYPEY